MRQLFLIAILFFSGFLNSQNKRSANEPQAASFSTCQVTLAGSSSYAATITNGIVQDVNGHKWALPHFVTTPKGGKITVTATSITPGAITALPGQIKVIVNPTAGWTSVTNRSPATPGQSMEAQCQQALRRTTDHLFAFEALHGCYDDCFQPLIPVYSNGKIDVYVDQRSLDRAIAFRLSNGNFAAHLYFVFLDESTRQQAIANICENFRTSTSCPDKLKQELKYVLMNVGYSVSSKLAALC